MDASNRLKKLRGALADRNIAALLVSNPDNRYYLSGFSGSAGYLLITADKALLATDSRYVEQAKQQSPDYRLFEHGAELEKWLGKFICGLGVNEISFESDNISFRHYSQINTIAEPLGITLAPVNGIVETLRTIKDADELSLIQKAAAISDAAIEYIRSMGRAGMSELEVAWEIEKFMREHGSQAIPFDVIVAAGRNAAMPHHKPCDYVIKESDPVIIDIGAKCSGYVSDVTRTINLGLETEQFSHIYNIVLQAQLSAQTNIRAGMSGYEADRTARSIIETAGYGDKFGHGVGHGIGIAVHESPRIGASSQDILQDNMVFTIEPGIYLPDWGGVRIEDSAVLQNGRIRVLSTANK
ncbi:MAG: aminopeptidase P family protein [Dehalococcoidia bacterium]|nr:aminopeptidase P family protein [Dehalococcoidia bacterium]